MDLEDGNEENERDAENLEVSDPSVPGSEVRFLWSTTSLPKDLEMHAGLSLLKFLASN